MKKIKPFETSIQFKAKSNGAGIQNRIFDLISIKPFTFKFGGLMFKTIAKGGRLTHYPVVGSLFKRIMKLTPYDRRYTQSVVIPLDIPIQEKGKGMVLPIDMMKKVARDASCRVGMNQCICRTGNECKDYPLDMACIMIGEGARFLADRGLGHLITPEEADARIDRAASLGLIGQAVWVEMEQLLWGFHNENMDKFLELCFCCPCCCAALNMVKRSTQDVRSRFKSIGWMAEINDNCINCGKCIEPCIQHAISSDGTRCTVDHDLCMGCGVCKTVCRNNAIEIKQINEMKKDIKDYFSGLDLKL